METKEIKTLLKLLGKRDYKGKVSEVKPNSKTRVSETENICRSLRDRELIAGREDILKIKLTAAGKALLKLDTSQLPITRDELKILQSCSQSNISPSKIRMSSAQKRNELIESLRQKGLIAATATQIKQVWLTERGKEFLLQEYYPQGTASVLSLDLLGNYLHFCRKHLSTFSKIATTNSQENKPTDAEILETIINLDKEMGTDNYLPIFSLRQKLQPPLSRQELDEALYRLQKQNKLELSSLVEAVNYTPEQISAGISQEVGGSLFFLIVNE
jgi:predicted transcriptional regulator